MLSEVVEYYNHRKRRQSLSTIILFSLTFDSSSSLVASGSTTGLLTIHSLKKAAALSPRNTRKESIIAQYDLSQYGSINSLETCSDNLFIATDSGILTLDWGLVDSNEQPKLIFDNNQVNALSSSSINSNSIVGACSDGSLVCIHTDSLSEPEILNLSGGSDTKSYAHTISTSPLDRHCIVTGCNDGSVRQFDLRRSKGIVRELQSSNQNNNYVSSVQFNPDGTYILVASSDRKVSSFHLSSGCLIQSNHLPFLPQSMAFSNATLYIGGSDRRVGHSSVIENSLYAFDSLCEPCQNAPASAGGIYAVASHPSTQSLVAAGFTHDTSPLKTQRLIDVYIEPPIRSLCLSV